MSDLSKSALMPGLISESLNTFDKFVALGELYPSFCLVEKVPAHIGARLSPCHPFAFFRATVAVSYLLAQMFKHGLARFSPGRIE